MAILKKNLLSGMTVISSHLRMRIDIMKEEYERACCILAGKTYFRFVFYIVLIRPGTCNTGKKNYKLQKTGCW